MRRDLPDTAAALSPLDDSVGRPDRSNITRQFFRGDS